MTTYNEGAFIHPITLPLPSDGCYGIAEALLGTVQRHYVQGALSDRDEAYVAEARARLASGPLRWREYGEAVHRLITKDVAMTELPETKHQPTLKAPFPYFGGKSRAAAEVWQRFGKVQNYVEGFFGSGAVLLGCPWPGHTETVNDADGLLSNFWRALQADPDGVAQYADYPVCELDLHSRHRWLVNARPRITELLEDPDAYDSKAAGWWVWGISQWIGSGWCQSDYRNKQGELYQKRPHLISNKGVNRNLDLASPAPVANVGELHRKLPHVGDGGRGLHRASEAHALVAYLRTLAARLRRVRVTCGDFERVLGPSVTWRHGVTGVFLDPPYDQALRADVYAVESDAATRARAWAIANGDNPLLRIAYCGYDNAEVWPDGWAAHRWKAAGGYGGQGEGRGRENASKEVIWFSPHCINELPLFAYEESKHL